MIKNLVLSGGSIKGICYYGVLKALYENKDFYNNITTFAGASAGSIFATFLYLNIDYEHLEKFLDNNFEDLLNYDLEYLFEEYGLDKCEDLMKMLDVSLGEYKDITFREGFEKTGKRLIISSTCLSNYNIEYFDYISHPNLKISQGIRASISIPILFTPVTLDNKVYIDGAILEPLPLSIFDKKDTLGIWITDDKNYSKSLNNMSEYIFNFMNCVKNRLNKLHEFEKKYNLIKIKISDISIVDFGISIEKKRKIIDIGYDTMIRYLKKNV